MLVEGTLLQWKQFCEGIARGDVGPFEWVNLVDGTDAIREYRLDGEVQARMTVYDSISDRPAYELTRKFEIGRSHIEATAYIYVPTDDEYEEWGDYENDPANAEEVLSLPNRSYTDHQIKKREQR